MIKNPIHLRLAHLLDWQLKLFMVCLCTRMYPNYAFFCRQLGSDDFNEQNYKKILDLIWESLLVKGAKIDFDRQLEKLEGIIPEVNDESPYSIYPAVDACQALSEVIHAYLSGDVLEHAVKVSEISLSTIADLEMTEHPEIQSIEQLKTLPSIVDELDLQWEIYRLLKAEKDQNENAYPIELIQGLRSELKEINTSNIGVFLSN